MHDFRSERLDLRIGPVRPETNGSTMPSCDRAASSSDAIDRSAVGGGPVLSLRLPGAAWLLSGWIRPTAPLSIFNRGVQIRPQVFFEVRANEGPTIMTDRLELFLRPAAVLAAIVACGFLTACNNSGEQARAAPQPPTVTVASPLARRLTEWDEFTGRFEATAAVDVRPRVSGYLQTVKFADGQMVKAGDPLFVIDPRPYQAAVDRAKADLDSAQAKLDWASSQLARAQKLVNSPALSVATLDERMQDRRAAGGALQQAAAALQAAQLNLDFTNVRAPISGRISNRRVDVGNLVTGDPNATLLTTIVALDPIYFVFDMSEADFLAYQRAVTRGSSSRRETARRSSRCGCRTSGTGRVRAR